MNRPKTGALFALLFILLGTVMVPVRAADPYVLKQSLSKVEVVPVAPLGGVVVHALGNGLIGNGETYVHFLGFERDRNLVRFGVFSKWNGLSSAVVREYEVTIPMKDGQSEWFTLSLAPLQVMTIDLKIDAIDALERIHMAQPKNLAFKTGK